MNDSLSLAFFMIATAIYIGLFVWLMVTRRRTHLVNLKLQHRLAQSETGEDAVVADWARHTVLNIVTNSGMVWSTTLAGLRTAELGAFRTWAAPVSVAILPEDDDRTRALGSDRG